MKTLKIFCAIMLLSQSAYAAEDTITIIGSTTVFPFISLFSEQFSKKFSYKTPVIESVGTGPALKSFCTNKGPNSPDIAGASRRMKKSESELCNKNKMGEILEIKFGYDGIAVATSNSIKKLSLSRGELFNALFAYSTRSTGKLAPNTFINWNEISPSLPDLKIMIYGPHKNTGTHDSIVQLAIKDQCMVKKTFVNLVPDIIKREQICSSIREDSAFVEIGASESLVVRKIQNDPRIVGVFGLVFLLKNLDKLQGSTIDGIEPTVETVSSGVYPFSRTLYVYVKKDNISSKLGLKDFVTEVVSPSAIGNAGYLVKAGLAPLNNKDLDQQRNTVLNAIKNIKPVLK